jgi:hypothetical protein
MKSFQVKVVTPAKIYNSLFWSQDIPRRLRGTALGRWILSWMGDFISLFP